MAAIPAIRRNNARTKGLWEIELDSSTGLIAGSVGPRTPEDPTLPEDLEPEEPLEPEDPLEPDAEPEPEPEADALRDPEDLEPADDE